jgi:hypothetical protein
MTDEDFPEICTELDISDENSTSSCYHLLIKKILNKVLPKRFFELYENLSSFQEELIEYLQSLLPLAYSTTCHSFPGNISFVILYKYRSNAFRFCYEMISRWLVPGKRSNVLVMYAVDFSMPELGNEMYTLGEIVLRVESREEYEEIQRNLPIIESEICLGMVSSYYARRILEIKGLSSDEKTAMIQEYIAYMTSRRPEDFSYDVFTEMQHVLVMCRDDFKALREVRHLSRIICIQYLFRKSLREAVRELPEKRHLFLKIFKAKLRVNEEQKTILGLIVAVNFLRDKEVFEETHLINAISNYIPAAQAVPNSFVFNRRGNEPICTLYLEIEKSNGAEFSGEEMQLLRQELPADLEGRVEHLMHPVFMPRNEEEVMRNILTLSQQIKFLRDIPQIFITFDEQTHAHLFFTVILVRVVVEDTPTIQSLFSNSKSFMEYVHDRSKTIGYLRKKYRKEATVFSLKVPKNQFLRRDHSIDLYKARQAVVSEISNAVGEVRDYNGGMISKQNELLNKVRELLTDAKKYNDLLLENFFYSLSPVIMRTVLEAEELKKLFVMLLESISDGFYNEDSYTMNVRAEPNSVYVMIAAEDRRIEDEVKKALATLNLPSSTLAHACVNVYDTPYLGYIYLCDDPLKQRKFCITLQHTLESCEHQKT